MKKGFLPVLLLFVVVTALIFILQTSLTSAGFNTWVLLGGNTVLFIITLISIAMNTSALKSQNTHGFMRNVYGGFMLKFFLVIIVVLMYVVLAKPINKQALFACLGLYLVYTFLGTRSVLTNKNS